MSNDTSAEPEVAEEPAEPTAPAGPAILATAKVEHIHLDKLDIDDTTYMFRAALRAGPLKESIAAEGQQMPIVVRKVGKTRSGAA